MFSPLNFFLRNKHFSIVLLIIEIFFTPDFCKDSKIEGETPPAPITKTLLVFALSTSLNMPLVNQKHQCFLRRLHLFHLGTKY